MANPDHLAQLKAGVEQWNSWRRRNRGISPDLSDADLRGTNLNNADLSDTILFKALLNGADLRSAIMCSAPAGNGGFPSRKCN